MIACWQCAGPFLILPAATTASLLPRQVIKMGEADFSYEAATVLFNLAAETSRAAIYVPRSARRGAEESQRSVPKGRRSARRAARRGGGRSMGA